MKLSEIYLINSNYNDYLAKQELKILYRSDTIDHMTEAVMKLDLNQLAPVVYGDGYRPNVGIIITNNEGKVFWARRVTGDGWQFPQGGLKPSESLLQGMYRELLEETGLHSNQVELLAHTKNWLKYDLPEEFLRNSKPKKRRFAKSNPNSHNAEKPFRGQKQVWFLLRLKETSAEPDLSYTDKPEFDQWRWVNCRYALENIVSFKRCVYKNALSELKSYIPT